MECETSDSKKVYKVFEASKRKKSRKKVRENGDEINSLVSEESKSLIHQAKTHGIMSAKASLQNIPGGEQLSLGGRTPTRGSSPSSPAASPVRAAHRSPCSLRRARRAQRDELSLALHAGVTSSPRSRSLEQEEDVLNDSFPVDQSSYIYTFLEEAIKKEKRRHRHHRGDNHLNTRRDCSHNRRAERERKGDERTRDRARDVSRHRDREVARLRDRERDLDDASTVREHCHRHRRRRHEEPSKDHENDKPVKEKSQPPVFDQTVLFETFAKLCSTITDKASAPTRPAEIELIRNQSHKSLQCEVVLKNESCEVDQRPVRLGSREPSQELINRSYTRVRSLEDVHGSRGRLRTPPRPCPDERKEKMLYDKQPASKYASKVDVTPSRMKPGDDDRCRDYAALPTRSCVDHACRRDAQRRDYRDYDERRELLRDRGNFDDERRRIFDEDRRRFCEQKTSRSFDPHRELYADEERYRRSTRSDVRRRRAEDARGRYDERDLRRYDDRRDKYYEEREREFRDRYVSNLPSKDSRWRRHLDRYDRNSVASRDDDYKERDGYSEREPDSAPSVADGEASTTVSGKSNYIKVVKQEIIEQREAMEKMMKLWKELMRCFKTISQDPMQDKSAAQDSAANVQESAAAQLRLWRECMRRYETVARDVGDTDARLMDEIAKQRSEMAEMASMWQECLQRYRDMSNDFNNLKQQLTCESPSRGHSSARPPGPPFRGGPPAAPPAPPAPYAEGEGTLSATPYCMPPAFPPQPPSMPTPLGGYGGSPLRAHASAPPAWWWLHEQAPPPARRPAPPAARRRSSPDSRRSVSHSPAHDRRHRHKDRERDDSRYKEKSKPNVARSEHRHRKR